MPIDPSLTATAAFWIDAIDTFDIHRDGPQWDWSLRRLLQPVLDDQDQVTELVREAIVIQQFLLELVTRRGVHRDLVVNELSSLLAS